MPVLAVAGQHQEPEAVAVAAQGHPQDLAHPVQSARRTGAAGRLLSESGRLVGAERAGRRPGQLRVLVERLHQSSKCGNVTKPSVCVCGNRRTHTQCAVTAITSYAALACENDRYRMCMLRFVVAH